MQLEVKVTGSQDGASYAKTSDCFCDFLMSYTYEIHGISHLDLKLTTLRAIWEFSIDLIHHIG